MGWNSIIKPDNIDWRNTILSDVNDGSEVYFVHSFYVKPEDEKYILAKTIYGGQEFCSVIRKGNVYGTQFHPEKSGSAGMAIIKYFSDL